MQHNFDTDIPPVHPAPVPEKEALLEPVMLQARSCQRCALCKMRMNCVWGEGNLNARVMFIGETPRFQDDHSGRPAMGPEGKLLTDIIEKGMGISRSDVYITNIVKCRTPGDRDPRPDELNACTPYLITQIDVIQPEVIVAVGRVAAYTLIQLSGDVPLGSPRGKWREYRGIPMMTIYHPSYLLSQRKLGRSPSFRSQEDRKTWYDIQQVMQQLNIPTNLQLDTE